MRWSSVSSAIAAASSSALVGILSLILFAKCAPSISVENSDGSADRALRNDLRPAPDDALGNGVATAAHTFSNSGNCKLDCWQPEIDKVKRIDICTQFLEPRREGLTGKRRLEGEV